MHFAAGFGIVFGLLLSPSISRAGPAPDGLYKLTCTNASVDAHGTLEATCKDFFNNQVSTKLSNADDCKRQSTGPGFSGDIWNVDGVLRCVFSYSNSASGRDTFDIISVPLDVNDNIVGETKIWRIDHPNVINPMTTYSNIVFKQGDHVKIKAGGCVQTGGSGDTWKEYVFPQGDNADRLYGGLLFIPGVTPTNDDMLPLRIYSLITQQPSSGYFFPVLNSPDAIKQSTLQLGYQDDGYSDNGYYSHDNGNPAQCTNNGPAWVEITIYRPKAPNKVAQRSPYRPGKNFDLTWWMDDSGVDDNGLPMNPMWAYQVAKGPDYMPSCVHPASGPPIASPVLTPSNVFDPSMRTCTSQAVSLDENSGFFDTAFEAFGYCSPGPPHGHVNWSIVTYQGNLQYRDYSGGWPKDDDDNFGLVTAGHAGETLLSEEKDGAEQPGIGVEFKQGETLDNFGTQFWKNFDWVGDTIIGQPAVITALMGVDAVHGGYSELHPVFALALLTQEEPSKNSVDETWDFFIRNQGNEGSCASHSHEWKSLEKDGAYTIQLPWPEGATDAMPTITKSEMWAESQTGFKFLGMEVRNHWTYMRFQLPPSSQTGIDGELTIHYTLAPSAPKKSSRLPQLVKSPTKDTSETNEEESEFGIHWDKLGGRIADPALRERFLNEANEAVRAVETVHLKHNVALPVNQTVKLRPLQQIFGAGVGKLHLDVATPDLEKARKIAALKTLMAKYSDQIKFPKNIPLK
jgi:hypothetical protein